MSKDGTPEVKNPTRAWVARGEVRGVVRASRCQEIDTSQQAELLAGSTQVKTSKESDPVSSLVRQIRTHRDAQPLGDGTSIRDLVEQGRR